MKFMRKIKLRVNLQASIGIVIAMFLAKFLDLKYWPTAGILTLLTIQDTKIETLRVSAKRLLGFALMLFLSIIIFNGLAFNIYAFGLYALIYAILNYYLDINVGLVPNSVLATHFLVDGTSLDMVKNELFLFAIGVGIGVVINLFAPVQDVDVKKYQDRVDNSIREILHLIGRRLMGHYQVGDHSYDRKLNAILIEKKIKALKEDIGRVEKRLIEATNNMVLDDGRYFFSYFTMRNSQANILERIWINAKKIDELSYQTQDIGRLMDQIQEEFDETNTVVGLLSEARRSLDDYRQAKLPEDRKEFEHRATMFVILNDLISLLEAKRRFVEDLSDQDIENYWNCRRTQGGLECD